jgi:hypothetical protein
MKTEHITEIVIGKKYAQPLYEVRYCIDGKNGLGESSSKSVILPPGIPTKDELINAFVRDKYSADQMEAIANNYMLNLSDMNYAAKFIEMQQWRGMSKALAYEALISIMDGTEDFDRLGTVRKMIAQYSENYDMSDNVNAFLVNGVKYWMLKPMRESLMMTLQEFIKADIEVFPFELNGKSYQLPCSLLSEIATQIEVYATQCMAVTKGHLAAISALETEVELDNYDYKAGYPKMLEFEIGDDK